MMLSSSTPNPVRPIGSTVTLTCTVHVELSPSVDAPVTVNIVVSPWHGLRILNGGLATNTSQLVMRDTTVYTLTDMVSSFGRTQSGLYLCRATLHSALNNTYIGSSQYFRISVAEVTAGEIILFYNYYSTYGFSEAATVCLASYLN